MTDFEAAYPPVGVKVTFTRSGFPRGVGAHRGDENRAMGRMGHGQDGAPESANGKGIARGAGAI